MRVRIKLLATYRRYLPPGASSPYELEIPVETCVEDLLARLPVPQEEAKVVLVNGLGPQPGQVLREGDILCLFPAAAGG